MAMQVSYDRLMNELMDAKIVIAQHRMQEQNHIKDVSDEGNNRISLMAQQVEERVKMLSRDHQKDKWKQRCLKTEQESAEQKRLIQGLRNTVLELQAEARRLAVT